MFSVVNAVVVSRLHAIAVITCGLDLLLIVYLSSADNLQIALV